MSSRPLIITLPDSPNIRAALEVKRQEYDRGLPEEVVTLDDFLVACKYILLEGLLCSATGAINTDQVLMVMNSVPSIFTPYLTINTAVYDQACQSIAKMCAGKI